MTFLHPALFYRGEDEFLAGVVPFVRAGLGDGQPVAVAVPGERVELVRDELGTDGHRVAFVDMARDGRNPGRILPGILLEFAERHPAAVVRIVAEPVWPGRSLIEYPACAQHEALVNTAFDGRGATVLCPYDAVALPEHVLADAEATHPLLLDASGAHTSPRYAPERIADAYNAPLPEPNGALLGGGDLLFAAGDISRPRMQAATHAARLGMAGPRIVDLELAVNELATNSVVHGGGTGSMRLWAEDGALVCEVRDEGLLADPLAGRRPVPPTRPGGRGLLMVNHLADLVRLHRAADGLTVRIYFTLRPPA
ncbi:anti-sigma regulatory factor [Mangrovactinospora gilvigrisea]|uniref:Anti-sigma regulatory factor n=1 Tax=Mangrovactinospora gilvigrisea TaxID=1428644 RepID=A0A1J7C3U4_9ACTN|nr:anti-sigma factor RsbA family regulatory protein [Mangrovactinospora gilvigrisea]OIV36236.1 anti-sigma regulatory factor [Mangrovactinospora gilvigrisea]